MRRPVPAGDRRLRRPVPAGSRRTKRVVELLESIGWRRAAILTGAVIALASIWWAPPLLAQLAFFRVQRVEITGVRYLSPDEVFARLEVDTSQSVWDDVSPMRARVMDHPQVREARVGRRLPGTLVVRIMENPPIALVPSSDGLRPVDASGRELPFDPSSVDLDLPLLAEADSTLAALLGAVRERDPSIFERISDVRRLADDHIVLRLAEFSVRASPDLTPARLADIIPVEQDLSRRGARVVELDLRFRDQVIARLQ